MTKAHLYIFSDASPDDWLADGKDERWHTIVNFLFQSDPSLQSQINRGVPHSEILNQDKLYADVITELQSHLRSGQLRKWGGKNGTYKTQICKAFTETYQKYKPMISACSFQEKTLRISKPALLNSYNDCIGGIEGRGIGFEAFKDAKGRLQMKHSFFDFNGKHEIQCPENQMLVILLMSYFIGDQYKFYKKHAEDHGFDALKITMISDKLSGNLEKNEKNLRYFIDPEGTEESIVLTRSPTSDNHSGDLIADNLAGWLNSAISNPSGEWATLAKNINSSGVWCGWHMLVEPSEKIEFVNAIVHLTTKIR